MLCDVAPDSYEMDYAQLEKLITPRTKAIIPVDLGGVMCDYDALFAAIDAFGDAFTPANARQQAIGRIAVVADGRMRSAACATASTQAKLPTSPRSASMR